jgi:transcriptional regulator with XRE-family HTH domain
MLCSLAENIIMFAEFIRNSGETRSAWAERLGISKSFLSDLLNQNRLPSLDLAVRIERATGGVVLASGWIKDPANPPTPDKKDAA